jgi:hypothetical protein
MRFIAARPVDERTTNLVERRSSSNFGAYSMNKAMPIRRAMAREELRAGSTFLAQNFPDHALPL